MGGFEPYQNYTASVTAATVVGDGPAANTSGRTDLYSEERERTDYNSSFYSSSTIGFFLPLFLNDECLIQYCM